MKPLNLLIVDDEDSILSSLKFTFETNFNVEICDSGEAAIELIKNDYPVNLILTDERMANLSGHDVLQFAHEYDSHTIGMLMTGFSDMGNLIEAVNLGHIYAYIHKPWRDDELRMLVSKAEQHYRLNIENSRLNEELIIINKDLEKRVEQRTQELNEQKELLKEANEYLNNLHKKSVEELKQARLTQQFFLPETLPSLPGIQLAVKYSPMQEIGGDIYDVTSISENKLGIWLADVTGHGISAALISMMIMNLFNTYSFRLESLSLMFEKINAMLFNKIPAGKFATALSMTYDTKSRQLTYSSAGHFPPYVLRPSTGKLIPLEVHGLLLGALDNNIAHFNEASMTLEKGDKVFLYTDGIFEIPLDVAKLPQKQHSVVRHSKASQEKTHEWFGSKRLKSFLQDRISLPIDELLEVMYQDVLDYTGQTKYRDDVTLIGLEITR